MAQQQCAVTGPVIDILSALHIPLVRTFSPFNVQGIGFQKTAVVGYAVGKELLCTLVPSTRCG
jgi:hypothetical protein